MLGWPGLASGRIEAYPYSFVSTSADGVHGEGQNPSETGGRATDRAEPHGYVVCDGPTTPDGVSAYARDADGAAADR